MDFAVSATERGQFLPVAEWVDRVAVAPARPVQLVATAASRSGLRVVGSVISSQPGGFR
jgi:hypothetical protein